MAMDEATRGSLEILENSTGSRNGSLIATLDRCSTGAGSRLLAEDLSAPLLDVEAISDRLALVRRSMDAAKARMRTMSRAALTDYAIALTSPLVLGNLTGLSGRGRPLFNVTISNVPGPTETLYWNGAEMQGLYPASLLQDGYALNITQTSYRDQMAFGITADRAALPRVQRLIDHLDDELTALESLA